MEDKIWGYPFADVDATAYYGTAVYWARLNGIAGGYDDATFGPNAPYQSGADGRHDVPLCPVHGL